MTNGSGRELPAMDVPARIDRLRGLFGDAGVDALLVTDLINIRYLTGFSGSAALLLVAPDALTFVTDGRYRDQSADQLAAAGVEARVEVETGVGQRDAISAAARPFRRIGLEADHATWAQARAYCEKWFDAADDVVPTRGLVAGLRRVKDEGERARVERACRIADEAFAAVKRRLLDGPTEVEFALELEYEMRRRGAHAVSFEPIVASGPNAARPHARPGNRTIERGELVVLDFGSKFDGYCSDMTRTVSIGDPGADARRIYDVVLESQQAGRAAVKDGVAAADVDRACRDVIADAGFGDAFLHGTGHGVGLEIHEDPRVASTSGDTLSPGHVVTIEPGVYLTGTGGVRIEDTVVVTSDGCEVLTQSPKDLTVE